MILLYRQYQGILIKDIIIGGEALIKNYMTFFLKKREITEETCLLYLIFHVIRQQG